MKVGPDHFRTPVAREGVPFILAAAGLSAVLFWAWRPLGWVSLLLPAFVVNFFRNPPRLVPTGPPGRVVSPADGKIVVAGPDPGSGRVKVSIFMNVFNVHLNRIPVDGSVERIAYFPGAFLNASFDKASEQNERNRVEIRTKEGTQVIMVQVAGLIARRILCYAEAGDTLSAGTIFGLIRFGSRVDLDLPAGTTLSVRLGETVKGGETVLGILPE
ncbi:MAG: phosphatidylserine decarboxylase family protein [Nitrospirae bacterium]|nr:phosphatidylserine decarboxylase family protein [Nitrospirota bacterium]